jgi:aminopeptidase
MDVALGAGACGVFSNSDDLWIKLHKSGQFCGDRMWRMPLFQLYSDQIKSHLADINNISTTIVRSAGACTAAAFLSKFVTCKEWAHVDIAGVMRNKDGLAGRPTRTVVEYLNLLARIHRT